MSEIFDWSRPKLGDAGAVSALEAKRRAIRRRRIAVLILLVLIVACIAVLTSIGGEKGGSASSVHSISFGQAFTRALKQPLEEDTAISRVISETPYISSGSSNRREVALTFDDGPGPYTSKVIDILKRTKTPATFFVVSSMIGGNEAILKSEIEGGFVIGDHTRSHPNMGLLSAKDQLDEILTQSANVQEFGAPMPRLYRPPYRSFDDATFKHLKKLKMLMVLWSVDTQDYQMPGADALAKKVLADARPGSIVLMHDAGGDRSQTVAALPKIIKGLKKKGYKFVTVPRMLVGQPPPSGQPMPSESNN